MSCTAFKVDSKNNEIITYLDDYIIHKNLKDYKEFGGISGIDQINDSTYILVADSPANPRLYSIRLNIENKKFGKVELLQKHQLQNLDKNEVYDLESIRYDKANNNYWVSSEGHINQKKSAFITKLSADFKAVEHIEFKPPYTIENSQHNGMFEGLDIATDGFWFTNELPLKTDGNKPTLVDSYSPVRLAFYNFNTNNVSDAYAVNLSRVKKIPLLPYFVNGITEILQLSKTKFLWLERSYSAGHKSKGNSVFLWLVTTENATNIAKVKSLKNDKNKIKFAKKELLFNFNSIKPQLKQNIVDNIEGMSFGPQLNNGNRSLILVSDNNFNSFAPQINQLILLELKL
ncbi:esterase-like activity of phytase family protein [Psychroflexus sp. ALD_RP9]|uniref:esterase-like activity of phytase family protein n=1 Tax=Psychroflexus sp. ALD_RP9 TaxID=2777186 RepID=UPI001A8D8C81|nr:esterase-like activity of phytase family protein [Psychroflexus sp. ALD_RP9]QSS97186.1 esterase-like activity of phytase family protein [Psychroflexus sp. ALD_RP9]